MRNYSSRLTYYVRYFKIYILLPEIFYNSCVLINLIPFSLVGKVDEKQGDENKLRCIYLRSHMCSIFLIREGLCRRGNSRGGETGRKHLPLLLPQVDPSSHPSFLNQKEKIIWSDSGRPVGPHSPGRSGLTLGLKPYTLSFSVIQVLFKFTRKLHFYSFSTITKNTCIHFCHW